MNKREPRNDVLVKVILDIVDKACGARYIILDIVDKVCSQHIKHQYLPLPASPI